MNAEQMAAEMLQKPDTSALVDWLGAELCDPDVPPAITIDDVQMVVSALYRGLEDDDDPEEGSSIWD